jgi:hypothetical protein
MQKYYWLIVIVLFYSCSNTSSIPEFRESKRDTFLKKFITYDKSTVLLDTSESGYKFLRAYYYNDTGSLNILDSLIKSQLDYERTEGNIDSCVFISPLKELGAQESYRFEYTAPFCRDNVVFTITRNYKEYSLNVVLYQMALAGRSCKVKEAYDKKLTLADWEKFEESLMRSDFWGLKPDNGKRGLDGGSLFVYGYIKADTVYHRLEKSHMIYRWVPGYYRIGETLDLLFLFSELKQGCKWILRESK